MKPLGVMQVVDSLNAGGLERVAVNIANHLPAERYRSHLCVTRAGGPLADVVAPEVRQLHLQRTGRFDFGALQRLKDYVRENDIQILHAHGTSVFLASQVPAKLLWHDHFGRYATEERPAWLYRLATHRAAGVIAVNEPLAKWARERLKVKRVWYVPNFVSEPPANLTPPELPGKPGSRIVCVANLRPEKDHLTLLAAMRELPAAQLIMVGQAGNAEYLERVKAALPANAIWLGARPDVAAILRGCDVGVLSSASEGLPLALIEYGMHGLPAVATRVGQCAEVLDGGRAGWLVPPGDGPALAAALREALQQRERGAVLRERVHRLYSATTVMKQIEEIYRAL
ncbi:MAG: N-acetyl-alpha-D-glucosaminyl L-malate synthase [Verrucomicrobiae bacterium]|nr:N-acetyl-alpha-D-glucosaminyl L-malate synthase [Verrucomicrobiae bacterium]